MYQYLLMSRTLRKQIPEVIKDKGGTGKGSLKTEVIANKIIAKDITGLLHRRRGNHSRIYKGKKTLIEELTITLFQYYWRTESFFFTIFSGI